MQLAGRAEHVPLSSFPLAAVLNHYLVSSPLTTLNSSIASPDFTTCMSAAHFLGTSWQESTRNVTQTNSFSEYSLSASSIKFARWQHTSRSWSLGCILNPNFGGRGGRRGQRWYHSKERMMVSCIGSCDQIALFHSIPCHLNQATWPIHTHTPTHKE